MINYILEQYQNKSRYLDILKKIIKEEKYSNMKENAKNLLPRDPLEIHCTPPSIVMD